MDITQLETPALLLDYGMMQQNMRVMAELIQGTGMRLYPHYKSHKCPQIALLQIEQGAAGITCAKLSEAEDLAQAGVQTIVIANQVVQEEKLAKLASLAKRCHLTVCVDSEENILALEEACARESALLHVLVEYDTGMHRCGAGSFEEVLSLAQCVAGQKHLRFHGIQAYAGHLSHEKDGSLRRAALGEIEERVALLRDFLREKELTVHHICGGSTGFVAEKPENTAYTQLQCGSYLFCDHSFEGMGIPFRQSLFVLTTVLSVKADRVVVDCGVKSLSMDQEPPYFPAFPEAELVFSEEHTTILTENSDLLPGDMLMMIPGHCCTTVNIFDRFHVMNGEEILHVWPITSRGKAQ